MSDNQDSFPIDVWPATAGFLWSGVQLATAIIDLWKRKLRRRRSLAMTTDFEKILNGEKIYGWETAITSECLGEHKSRCYDFCFVRPYWPEKESGACDDTPSTVLVSFLQKSIDGRDVFTLRRYSTICPEISATIMQIVFKEDSSWEHICAYLTDRVVAYVFESSANNRYRVVLINTISKSHQSFAITPPVDQLEMYAILPGDISRRQIVILFLKTSFPEEEPEAFRKEFINAPYEIPTPNKNTNDDVLVQSYGWQSITIQTNSLGQSTWTYLGINPPICISEDMSQPHIWGQYFVMTYDRRGKWRRDKYDDWLATFRSTDHGSKLLNVGDSLYYLSLPFPAFEIPPFKYFIRLSGYHIGGALFLNTGNEILRRQVYPATLKKMSAEAFCKSNRRYKFADLKKAIGFDIFDGIVEERERNEWMVLYF